MTTTAYIGLFYDIFFKSNGTYFQEFLTDFRIKFEVGVNDILDKKLLFDAFHPSKN